jgi:DNA-binding MarR family transcriptional regulator
MAQATETGEAIELPAALRTVIARLSRLLRPTRAGGGLTPTQISVLFTLVREGPLPLAVLADREALNPTMLSRAIGALADAGLVTRTAAADDRRSALAAPTAAGRRLRERIHAERNAALGAALADLAPEQRRSIECALPALEELVERLR